MPALIEQERISMATIINASSCILAVVSDKNNNVSAAFSLRSARLKFRAPKDQSGRSAGMSLGLQAITRSQQCFPMYSLANFVATGLYLVSQSC